MRLSFRLRIALLSALLAGLALASFTTIALWQIRQTNLNHLEEELRAQAEREVSKPRRSEEWQRFEQELTHSLAADLDGAIGLLVESTRYKERFRGKGWPPNMDMTQLPWPAYPRDQTTQPRPPDGAPYRSERRGVAPGPPPKAITVQWVTPRREWCIALAVTPNARLAIVADLRIIEMQSAEARQAFILAFPLTLVLIGLGAWFLSARALSPIRLLTGTINGITAKGLDQRIDGEHADKEFKRLIQVFNHMLERLERSFTQASRFSSDAAHELNTPLTILQGEVEQAMNRKGISEQEQRTLAGIMDEIRRLARILRKLLLLSRADAGRLRLQRERYDLSAALQELIEESAMLTPALTIDCAIPPSVVIHADRELMDQLLHNLINNALKYNRESGWIDIRLSMSGKTGITLVIRNASQTLSPSTREKLFERFYRNDPAHGRKTDGTGLGLSIAREIAIAHEGTLELTPPTEGETGFVLRLPIDKGDH